MNKTKEEEERRNENRKEVENKEKYEQNIGRGREEK